MFCSNCGAELGEGALFCKECGQPQDPSRQAVQTAPVGGFAAPPVKPKKGLSKKAKIGIGVGAGVLVLAAIALVLVFVVFADSVGIGGGGDLFRGDTEQTQFANDCVAVVTGALKGIGGETLERMGREPFDIEIDMEASQDGEKSGSGTIEMAYDKLALGIATPGEAHYLLIEDALIVENWGVTEYEIDSKEDLSKPMTLKDRLGAVLLSLAAQSDIDLKDVLETLINSIESDCISSRGSTKTLTMDQDDVMDMLKNFEDATKDDDDLNDAIEELTDGMDVGDIVSLADVFLGMMGGFEIEIEVGYTGSEPTSLNIKLDAERNDDSDFEIALSYEQDGKDTQIDFEYMTPRGDRDITAQFTIERTGDGAELGGTVQVGSNEKYTIDGSEEWDGEEVSGRIEIEVDSGGNIHEMVLEYEEVLHFGMPEKDVADDRRFEIDTDDADKKDLADLFGFGRLVPMTTMPDLDFVLQDEDTAAVEDTEAVAVAESTPIPVEEATEEIAARAIESVGVVFAGMGTLEEAIADAVEDYAAAHDIEVTIMASDMDSAVELELVQNLIAQGVDALFVYSWSEQEDVITDIAEEAGVAAVFIDSTDRSGHQSVRMNYYDVGVVVGRQCATDNVYVLTPRDDHWLSQELEAGMNETMLDIIGMDVTYFDESTAADFVANAINENDVETVICLDPVSSPRVLETLEAEGFDGELICVTEEELMADMHSDNVYTVCVYFPVDMVAEALFLKAEAVLIDDSGYDAVFTVAPATQTR